MLSSKFIGLAAAALVLGTASPAAAQQVSDVRCLLVTNLFAKNAKDAKARQAAEASKFFYLGRINGRLNATQLKSQALAASKTLNAKNASQVMTACAQQVQTASNSIQATMKQLAPGK